MNTPRHTIEELLRATLAERAAPEMRPPDPAVPLLDLDLEFELMALVLDSATAELVHRGDPWRVLRFAVGDVELDLEVDTTAHVVIGEVSAGGGVAVEAIAPDWSHVTAADDLGRFRVPLGDVTTLRLRLRLPGGRVVTTPVIHLTA